MDGVTVAEEIELADEFESMSAQMMKEAASKASDVADDETTTATILAQAIYREGSSWWPWTTSPWRLSAGSKRRWSALLQR